MCPNCGSDNVTPTTEPDKDGICEYRCDDCGEYFTDECGEEDTAEQWREFAYLLVNALADEVHYSQTPSNDTLALLGKVRLMFPNTELITRLDDWKITKMKAIE